MRGLPLLLLAALLAVPALTPAAGPALLRLAYSGSPALLEPRAAWAQETLEFKPVPAESVTALERARHRAAGPVAPAEPAPAAEPAIPAEPEAATPAVPQVEVRSHSGDLSRVGSDIHIESDEVVEGDVMAIRGDVTVDGHVEGSVVAMGGDVYLSSTARVDRDVVCVGGKLHEEPGATVRGERVTALGGRGSRALKHYGVHPGRFEPEPWRGPVRAVSAVIWFFIFLGVAWLIAHLAPGRTRAAVDTLAREPGWSTVVGFGAWLMTIPSLIALSLVVALLCITIIGIPLALAALVGYAAFFAVMAVWGYVVGAGALGERLALRQGRSGFGIAQAVVWGVLAVAGLGLAGQLLRSLGLVGPLRGLGTFLHVIAIVASSVMAVVGGGAWLKSEFRTGWFGRRWGRRKNGPPAADAPGAAGPAGPPTSGTPPPAPGAAPPPAPATAPP
ncbi:MAG: polymer-forming cytoskeletal protein, partial [Candidatus Eisenbacteria bacterium]|nr:polymer-forming cytoskeletal protein [Candidatus Eisenbacteria bacterium]